MSGCPTGKQRYKNRLEAKIALARTYHARNSRRAECRYYACPDCFGWHLTSKRLAGGRS